MRGMKPLERFFLSVIATGGLVTIAIVVVAIIVTNC